MCSEFGDSHPGITRTLLSFVGSLLLSLMFHGNMKGMKRKEEGSKKWGRRSESEKLSNWVQLQEKSKSKRNQWEESSPFLSHWFSLLTKPCLLHYYRWFHLLPVQFLLLCVCYNISFGSLLSPDFQLSVTEMLSLNVLYQWERVRQLPIKS